MLFPTIQFALFFPVVLALSWALMSRPWLWKPFILVASYVFYGYASWKFCLLLAGITVGNQAAALLLHRVRGERAARWIVGITVALDLGVLAIFKYYGFFAENVQHSFDEFGIAMPLALLAIALPVAAGGRDLRIGPDIERTRLGAPRAERPILTPQALDAAGLWARDPGRVAQDEDVTDAARHTAPCRAVPGHGVASEPRARVRGHDQRADVPVAREPAADVAVPGAALPVLGG
jgi:hypothetical protein